MLRSFDLKQNVNSHAFKELRFLPKSRKNEGMEEVIKKSTEQQHLSTISFKTKGNVLWWEVKLDSTRPLPFTLYKKTLQCNGGRIPEANAKISIITPKNQ